MVFFRKSGRKEKAIPRNELTRNQEEDFSNVGTGGQDRFRSEISLSCKQAPDAREREHLGGETCF